VLLWFGNVAVAVLFGGAEKKEEQNLLPCCFKWKASAAERSEDVTVF